MVDMNPSGIAAKESRMKYFKIVQCALQCIICSSILFGQKSLYLAECIEKGNLTAGPLARAWLFLMKGPQILASLTQIGQIWLIILPVIILISIQGRKVDEKYIDLAITVLASVMAFLIYSFYDAWRCMIPLSGSLH